MKRIFYCLIFFLCLVFVAVLFCQNSVDIFYDNFSQSSDFSGQDESSSTVEKPTEMRACWFSYLEWQLLLKNKNEKQFSETVRGIFNNLHKCGINTIMLHLRAFGDAFYESTTSPVSKYFSGNVDEGLQFDPLKIIIDIAREHNISIHGWINPLRTMSDEDFSKISNNYTIKKWYLSKNKSDYYMKDSTGKNILIPTNPEVRQFILEVVGEILSKYSLDGIHIDDYFYPSKVDELQENDIAYYKKIKPDCDINSWRRNGTSNLVREMCCKCHEANFNVKFGVSPQANLKNNYNSMFIDVKLWLSESGYIDYIMPQIYFGFENSFHPFDKTIDEWNNLIKNDVELYVGLAVYKVGIENDQHAGLGAKEWKNNTDILRRQEECCRKYKKYRGYCLYSYQSIFQQDGSLNLKSKQEIENLNLLF